MLTKLTLGTAQLGLDYGINNKKGKPSVREGLEILEYAYSHGVKSFDTAQAYGDSETIIGKWLKETNHKDIYLTSKIPSIKSENVPNSNLYDYLQKSVYNSLENLGVHKIDNLLLHDFNDFKYYGEELHFGLKKLKEKGYVKSVGYSTYDVESLKKLYSNDFDSVQFAGSVFNQRVLKAPVASELKQRSVKIFVRSVFVQGLLFMDLENLPIGLERIKKYIIKLNLLSKRYNISISEIAINYLRHHKNVDSVVFGVDSLEQLKEIINIPEESLIDNKIIEEMFFDVPNELVDPRKWRH